MIQITYVLRWDPRDSNINISRKRKKCSNQHVQTEITQSSLAALCTELPDTMSDIKTDAVFPLGQEQVVQVRCDEGYVIRGDKLITCIKDNMFTFTEQPRCGMNFINF